MIQQTKLTVRRSDTAEPVKANKAACRGLLLAAGSPCALTGDQSSKDQQSQFSCQACIAVRHKPSLRTHSLLAFVWCFLCTSFLATHASHIQPCQCQQKPAIHMLLPDLVPKVLERWHARDLEVRQLCFCHLKLSAHTTCLSVNSGPVRQQATHAQLEQDM